MSAVCRINFDVKNSVFRVSKTGYDAETDSDIDHMMLADGMILSQPYGVWSFGNLPFLYYTAAEGYVHGVRITHGLGYVPASIINLYFLDNANREMPYSVNFEAGTQDFFFHSIGANTADVVKLGVVQVMLFRNKSVDS